MSTHSMAPNNNSQSQGDQPSVKVALGGVRSGWRNWRTKHPTASCCIMILIFACVVLVAVVPPVCVIKGCGAGGKEQEDATSSNQINRLLVSFDEIGKTVKSKIPAGLHAYLLEISLKSGIQVVSFNSSKILEEVQRRLEQQSDLRILLRDAPLSQVPQFDPWSLLEPNISMPQLSMNSLQGRVRRRSAQQQQPSLEATRELGDELAYRQWANMVVHAPQAWNLSQGENVVVAIIDTGCDLNHPDLKGHLWVNSREIPNNGIDDDRNGYVDDVHGYDFAGPCAQDYPDDFCGPKPNPQDIDSHGSHCSGIVAAVRNNRVGIAGIAPSVKVMCLKVVPNDGNFYPAHIFKAIDYAVNMGAHIISCSFGPQTPNLNPTQAEKDRMANETALYTRALDKLKEKNMLLVAAAGNENTDLDRLPAVGSMYNPCSMARLFPEHVICVMATNDKDQRLVDVIRNVEQGTNYGSNTVDIGAPGLQIISTVPPLDKTNNALWANKTGSSMATPLVAGIGALIMSVMGTKTGNFYLGKEARTILVESADRLDGLPTISGSRVNAVKAVQQAYSRLEGRLEPVQQADFVEDKQSVMMLGFNETYYQVPTEPVPVELIKVDNLQVVDATTRATNESRLHSYKQGKGTLLVVKASVKLSQEGLYIMKVTTEANLDDLVVNIGQITLQNLTAVNLLTSTGGWYAFELRYRNPTARIDITMAAPNGGGEPKLDYLPVFHIATPVPPRDYYYAPSIGLSSAFQVLTRPPSRTIGLASILGSALELDQPYNYSAVVEDLNFMTPSAFRAALYPWAAGGRAAGAPSAVVGIAHTRLRAPSIPMRFKVTCSICALYVDSLRVLDVFDPIGIRNSVTLLSNCITFGNATGHATHDLTLRFAVRNTTDTLLVLSWLSCDSSDDGESAVSVTSHTVSNLFWRPDNGVAGYVAGMQCDVWAADGSAPVPPRTEPLLKFRLPTALTHSRRARDSKLPAYETFRSTGCSANETAGPDCRANLGLMLRDLFTNGSFMTDSFVANVDMRCWTFVDAGFRNGTTSLTLSGGRDANAYLGAQTIYQSQSPIDGTFKAASIAANTTTLNGHHQLFVIERFKATFGSLFEVFNATSNFTIDFKRTLLPIPVVSAFAPTGTTAGGSGSGTGRRRGHRRRLATATTSATLHQSSTTGDVGVRAAAQQLGSGSRWSRSRRGLQDTNTPGGYDARSLGASAYSLSQVPRNPALIVTVYNPDRNYNAKLDALSNTVLYNLTLDSKTTPPSTSFASTSYLHASVGGEPPKRAGPRYVGIGGFLRLPSANRAGASPGCRGGMAQLAVRFRDTPNQVTAIHFGDVTVRNGIEFPPSVAETETLVCLPRTAGDLFVPGLLMARSSMTDVQARYSLAVVNVTSRATTKVDRDMWYGTMR